MQTHANDVSDFLKWIAEVKKHFGFYADDQWPPWFRGQSSDWSLCPKLYRGEYGNSAKRKKWQVEDEIREEFIVRSQALSESELTPNDDWGWYFLMQHYGAPTRLLDWTEAALLSLYFAVNDNQGLTDGVVWALDPYKLNRIVMEWRKDWVICPNVTGVSEKDKKAVRPWLPERFSEDSLPQLPIAVYPTHIARRIGNQRSCFTIHGTNQKGLEDVAKNANVLLKIIIPAFRVQTICRELAACGIDESTAFPNLDGLGKSLHLKWYECSVKLPHENVLTRLRPSTVHKGGVGVFAIKKIRKGTHLFQGDEEEMLWVNENVVPKGPKEVRALYSDFAVINKERYYGCPKNFNRLTMAWYINEPRKGDTPNVKGTPETYEFYALRDIRIGEELTVWYDYSEMPKTKLLNKTKP